MPERHMSFSQKPVRLGEQLLKKGLLTQEQLTQALSEAASQKLRLGDYLINAGLVKETDVLTAVAEQSHIAVYRASDYTLDVSLKELIPEDFARRNRVVPLCIRDGLLYIALLDANHFPTFDAVEELTHHQMEPVLCTKSDFVHLFSAVYGQYSAFHEMLEELEQKDTREELKTQIEEEIVEGASEVPVIRLVNLILTEGVKMAASDIHIKPERAEINVRYRVEGLLRKASTVPYAMGPSVVSRIKIMANMDIAETRLPQDGRFTIKIEGREINVRVSTLPTMYGETIVMRLLDMSANRVYALPQLGMNDADYQALLKCVRKPYGMILSTGPTGSGKSSSLYAILQLLNREEVNIVTLEDPVEYRIKGVNQVQLNTRAGMTFSSGLRAILRQDPDILMVGEIRDRETAEIAVQAALTGHLVLSTLHTNDALSAVYRLMDMGIEPYLVSSVLLCSFAQRLVRKVCPHCRQAYQPDPALLAEFGLKPEDGPFYHGTGCHHCGHTGFIGRTAIFEVFPMNEVYQDMVTHGQPMQALYQEAAKHGQKTMLNDAADKIKAGITTVEEARRVTMV